MIDRAQPSRWPARPLAALALTAAALLAGCGTGSGNTPSAEQKELRIYNWADYIGKDTLADFEDISLKRTGLAMHGEVEALGQKGLEHAHELGVAVGRLGRFSEDAEPVGVEPVGAADNLTGADGVGADDATLEGNVLSIDLAVARGDAGGVGIADSDRLDRRDFKLRLLAEGGRAQGEGEYCSHAV